MGFSNLTIAVVLIVLFRTMSLAYGKNGVELSRQDVALLNTVVNTFPEILQLDTSKVIQYFDQVKNRIKKGESVQSFYNGLPEGSGKQHGRYDEVS